jgi:general secretion pathway protein G
MNRYLSQHRGDDGFTLFELLIVIIILAVLAGIVVFSVGTSRASATASSCTADAKSFGNALEQYKAQVGNYPPISTLASPPNPPFTALTTSQIVAGVTVGPFLRQLPGSTHYRIETDGQGGVFVYPIAPAPLNTSATGMEGQTVGGVTGDGSTDSLNFAKNPGVCSNSDIVS